MTAIDQHNTVKINTNSSDTLQHSVNPGTYLIKIGGTEYYTQLYLGGVYALLATATNDTHFVRTTTIIVLLYLERRFSYAQHRTPN